VRGFPWFGRRSLRVKMALVSLAVSLAAMTLLSIGIVVAMRYTFRQHLAEEVSTTAQLIAGNAGAAVLFNDAKDAGALLDALRANKSVLASGLYGRDGLPIASFHRNHLVARVPGRAPSAAFLRMSWDEIETAAEVLVEGASVGRVYLRVDLGDMRRFTTQIAGYLAAALLAAGVLAWVLSSRLQGVIARPVDDLARTAGEVSSSKNYTLRARKYGEDELSALTDSFNEMLETIQDRDRALRESEEKYRTLVEGAGDAIFVAQNGELPFVNARAVSLTGYTQEALRRTPWVELIHPDDRALLQERHRARMAGEPLTEVASFRLLRRGGEVRWVQMNSVSLAWEGRPATLNFARDVTEQVKMEEHLRKNQKMEAIGTLAGGIAHDFNNILGVMMGFVEIALLKIPKQSPVVENLQQVLAAAERAAKLVAQILTFSRQAESAPVPCELTPIVKETVKFMRASLPANIEIRESYQSVGMVVADPTQIHQIVMNLCTNAAHAMEPGDGVLGILLSEIDVNETETQVQDLGKGRYVVLSVSDTGTGIPLEVQGRIFEPYFTTKPTGKGTGLGLAVVHGIVAKAGGVIKVHSEPGVGTSFHVYLPVVERGGGERGRREAEEEAPRGTERVLVVDDEEPIVAMLRESLEALGYTVTAVTDSEEALRLFSENPARFDLVITDLTMPRMSGGALVRAMRAVRQRIPIILCTGFSEGLTQERLSDLGVGAVLTKPIPRLHLAREIRRILDGAGC